MQQRAQRLALAFCVPLLLVACRATAAPPLERTVSIDTHKLHISCLGQGSPTIVIDTGSGETYESWLPLMNRLAEDTRVCAYERAGYGQSEPGPLPRDAGREADELRLLLQRAAVAGPYVLVGHSLGGLNAQVFASKYPDLLAGVVLIDPPPLAWLTGDAFPELRSMFKQQAVTLKSEADALRNSSDPKERATAGFLTMMSSEMTEATTTTASQLAAIEFFRQMPLVVIASTQPNPQFGASAEAFQRFWIAQSEQLATKSGRGVFVVAEGSSHHVHLDAPQVVLDITRKMVSDARKELIP